MKTKRFNVERLFSALADRTRLRLLNLIGDDEVCVCYFVEVFKTRQPKISRHLAYLRRAGLVAARREGKWMRYRITAPTDARARRVFQEALQMLAEDPQMQKDRARLMKLCCAPQPPVSIKSAPRPISVAS